MSEVGAESGFPQSQPESEKDYESALFEYAQEMVREAKAVNPKERFGNVRLLREYTFRGRKQAIRTHLEEVGGPCFVLTFEPTFDINLSVYERNNNDTVSAEFITGKPDDKYPRIKAFISGRGLVIYGYENNGDSVRLELNSQGNHRDLFKSYLSVTALSGWPPYKKKVDE